MKWRIAKKNNVYTQPSYLLHLSIFKRGFSSIRFTCVSKWTANTTSFSFPNFSIQGYNEKVKRFPFGIENVKKSIALMHLQSAIQKITEHSAYTFKSCSKMKAPQAKIVSIVLGYYHTTVGMHYWVKNLNRGALKTLGFK